MCGPFVLAQTGETMARLQVGSGELRRLAGAALLPYHTGRAITYILLAVLLSLPLQLMSQLPQLRFIPAIALLLGALLFLVLAVRGLRGSLESGLFGAGIGSRSSDVLQGRCSPGRGVGAVSASAWCWGSCPCGLLYAAIGAAAATSNPLAAAMSMAVFTLGTFPDAVAGRLSRRLGSAAVEQAGPPGPARHRVPERHCPWWYGVALDHDLTPGACSRRSGRRFGAGNATNG